MHLLRSYIVDTRIFYKRKVRSGLLVFWVLVSSFVSAQHYNFRNFSVEQGLMQSEAADISQDHDGFLWIATYGGVSRFDGKEFVNYSRADGMKNSFCVKIYADKKKQIWIGTQTGLSVFNGRTYQNYTFSDVPQDNFITHIQEDNKGDVWVVAAHGKKLLRFRNGKYLAEHVVPGVSTVTALAKDKQNILWAAVYKKGIYRFSGTEWQMVVDSQAVLEDVPVKDFYFSNDNTMWIATKKGVYNYNNGINRRIPITPETEGLKSARTIAEDKEGVIWIGTNNGAYSIRNETVTRFNSERGLTDKVVIKIFSDKENNLWFATGGDGLFRYSGDMFTYFDKSSGLGGSLIMGLAEDVNKNIWMGIGEGSLARYDGKNITEFNIPTGSRASNRINCLFRDRDGNIWIGTSGNGVWIYDGTHFKPLKILPKALNSVNVIWQDSQQRTWFSTQQLCYYFFNDTLRQIKEIKELTSSYQELENGSILIGGTTGVYIVDRQNKVSKVNHSLLQNASVFSMGRWKDDILVGTSDQGLIAWNMKTNNLRRYSRQEGMSSDFIYSILVDNNNNIWCGTGRGINRIHMNNADGKDHFSIKVFTPADGLNGLECNMNVVLKDSRNRIWFGTNKGAFIYNPLADTIAKYPPHLVLQSVKLFSRPIPRRETGDTLVSWHLLPDKLKLAARDNHLTFHFSAVSISTPDSIKYQYRLEGLDKEYSALSNTPFVVYSGLPSGKYTFRVKGVTKEGVRADNEIAFAFEIMVPFYKTWWFQLLVIVFLITIGVAIQSLIAGIKEKRKQFLQNLRDEEQNKIRQKTSEDFHDEMGNKLTRITILSDILESKLDERTYEKNLVQQIRNNAGALYRGTKDILWSLDPSSDNFHEILHRIRDFGNELFQDTDIVFSFNGLDENYTGIKLPLDYSRNILMIFKEALNNVLKHSSSKQVSVTVTAINKRQVKIVLQDDGTGFDMATIEKGHGIDNIHIRTARINSLVEIRPGDIGGTVLSLFITFPAAS